MADFLSAEWIAELTLAARAARADVPPDAGRLIIEPVVRGVPALGEVRYRITFDAGSCTVVAAYKGGAEDGSADAPAVDVRLETDYVTAVALARGTANAQAALADGRLRVSGDVASLAAHAGALARLDDLFAGLRASTTYPPPERQS